MKKLIFIQIALVVLGAGCLPERGLLAPQTQPAELVNAAVIKTPSPILRDGKELVRIKAVDGQKSEYLENRAVVAPGTHLVQVEVELRSPGRSRAGAAAPASEVGVTRIDTSLTIEAKSDHEYLIEAREDERGVWVWASDTSNNDVVAGARPLGPQLKR